LHYAAAYGWLDCLEMLLDAQKQTNLAKEAVAKRLATLAALKK